MANPMERSIREAEAELSAMLPDGFRAEFDRTPLKIDFRGGIGESVGDQRPATATTNHGRAGQSAS